MLQRHAHVHCLLPAQHSQSIRSTCRSPCPCLLQCQRRSRTWQSRCTSLSNETCRSREDVHWIHAPLAFNAEARALRPPHHLQEFVAYIILVFRGRQWRRRRRGRRRRPIGALLVRSGRSLRVWRRHVRLAVYRPPLERAVSVLRHLLRGAPRARDLGLPAGDVAQRAVREVLLRVPGREVRSVWGARSATCGVRALCKSDSALWRLSWSSVFRAREHR